MSAVHHDPDRPAFGYQPTDDSGRALVALLHAERVRVTEAEYVAERVIEVPPYPNLDITIAFYRKAVAAERYARAVLQQVWDEKAAA